MSRLHDDDMALIEFDELPDTRKRCRYIDLFGFDGTEEGKLVILLLKVVTRILEYRLVEKSRELERAEFEEAFVEGRGWYILIPLIQAPLAFAELALKSLGIAGSLSKQNSSHMACLGGCSALLGFPSPPPKPAPNEIDRSLRQSPSVRRAAAKVLGLTADTLVFKTLLEQGAEKCIRFIMRLLLEIREDGDQSFDAFYDMLHVIFAMSKLYPEPLYRHIPERIMNILVDLSRGEDPRNYAKGIIRCLMSDARTEKKLLPILNRVEEQGKAWSRAPEENLGVLRDTLTPAMNTID